MEKSIKVIDRTCIIRFMANFLVLVNAWYSKKIVTGGEYHMLRVLKNWSQKHRISLIIPKIGFKASKEMLPNLNLFYFSSTKEQEKEIKSVSRLTVSYLTRIIRSILINPGDEPDVIITASHLLYDIIPAIILRRRYNSKLVVYNHGVWRPFRSYNVGLRSNLMLLNEKLSVYLCKRADIVFAINNETKDYLIHKGYKPSNITMMRNGVEHELIKSVKPEPKKYEASFCGRLVKRKGIYHLLDIWVDVMKYFPDGKLIIIGKGEEYEGLRRAIDKNGLEKNIVLTGYVPDLEKIRLFKSSKMFIYPSYEESWGITLTEAMACELPVVCYDLSAYNFLRNGIIKLDIGNKQLMAASIVSLLKDKNKRAEMGKNAKEESKGLNWDNISREELNHIDTFLKKSAKSA